MRKTASVFLLVLLLGACQTLLSAETSIHGRLYGQWAMDLSEGSDNENEFSLGRTYVTLKSKLSDITSLRITTDLVETEYATDKSRYEIMLKYAYFDIKPAFASGALKIRFGLQPTMYIDTQNKLWGRRYLSKTVGDMHKYLTTSDLGLSFHHTLGEKGKFGSLSVAVLNGTSYKALEEHNVQKDFGFFGILTPLTDNPDWARSTLLGQFYMGTQNRDFGDSLNSGDYARQLVSVGGLLAYKNLIDIGGDLNWLTEGEGMGFADSKQSGLSVFGTIYLGELMESHEFLKTLNLFGRLDIVNPTAETRSADDNEQHIIGGIECVPLKGFKTSVNFRTTNYDNGDPTEQMIYVNSLFKF